MQYGGNGAGCLVDFSEGWISIITCGKFFQQDILEGLCSLPKKKKTALANYQMKLENMESCRNQPLWKELMRTKKTIRRNAVSYVSKRRRHCNKFYERLARFTLHQFFSAQETAVQVTQIGKYKHIGSQYIRVHQLAKKAFLDRRYVKRARMKLWYLSWHTTLSPEL